MLLLGSAFQYRETFTLGEKIYSLNGAYIEKGTRCPGAFTWALRAPPVGLWFSLSGLQVVFQDGIVGGEAAELAVVIAQAVGHAVALVVAGILSLTF